VDCIKKMPMPEREWFKLAAQDTMLRIVIYKRSRESSFERHARFRARVNALRRYESVAFSLEGDFVELTFAFGLRHISDYVESSEECK